MKEKKGEYSTVKVSKDLLKRLQHMAIDKDLPVQDAATEAISQYLEREEEKMRQSAKKQ